MEQKIREANPVVVLKVTIDLDAVPGANYYGDDTARYVQSLLNGVMPHYNPEVEILRNDRKENSNV